MGVAAIPFQTTITPAVQNTTAFGNNIAGIYNGTNDIFTPTTSNTSDGLAHTIIITNNNAINLTSYFITIVGTDFNGETQTEIISGPDTLGTVNSTLYYTSLSYLSLNTNDGDNTFDIGINTGAISPAYPIVWAADKLELNTSTAISGFSVQYTRSPNLQPSTGPYVVNNYIPSSQWIWITWTSISTGVYQTLYSPVNIRFLFTSYTANQSFTFCYSQPRNI